MRVSELLFYTERFGVGALNPTENRCSGAGESEMLWFQTEKSYCEHSEVLNCNIKTTTEEKSRHTLESSCIETIIQVHEFLSSLGVEEM